MALRQTAEDYLKTIYILSCKDEVRGAFIADELGISRPTVCVTLRALEKEGYLTMDSTHAVHLTDEGKRIGMRIHKRFENLKKLLETLGVDCATASEDACKMEHAVSDKSFSALMSIIENKGV